MAVSSAQNRAALEHRKGTDIARLIDLPLRTAVLIRATVAEPDADMVLNLGTGAQLTTPWRERCLSGRAAAVAVSVDLPPERRAPLPVRHSAPPGPE